MNSDAMQEFILATFFVHTDFLFGALIAFFAVLVVVLLFNYFLPGGNHVNSPKIY